MSDDREGKWIWPFVLGFLLGVVVCLGTGGAFVITQQRHLQMEAVRTRMEAEMARAEAERQRAEAEAERLRLETLLKRVKEEKGKTAAK
jgi:hypothetical protein